MATVPVGFEERRLMRLLGLPAAARDPVIIITAAQMRLRRWRRVLNGGSVGATNRIRRIMEARDALLKRTCDAGRPDAGD